MPLNIGVSNNIPLQLKDGVNKTEFIQKVNTAIQDGKLTKSEYKELKDSMVNGRQSLNELLSQVGIATKGDLESVFAKKGLLTKLGEKLGAAPAPEASVKISDLQKKLISSVLSDKVILSQDAKDSIKEMKKDILPVDRSKLSERYSLNDVLFSPQVSPIFKKHCEKEFSSENFNFIHDVKTSIENPDKETLKNIYNSYIKVGSDNEINVSSKARSNAKQVFDNPNSSMEDMLKAIVSPVKEIKGILGDTYTRFLPQSMKDAMTADMQALPPGKEREHYFDNFVGTKFEGVAQKARHDDAERVLKAMEG
jgi:hypothetical protein